MTWRNRSSRARHPVATPPPNYWPDPKSGIGYQVQVEIPEHQMNSLEEVKNLPIARRSGQQIDLRNVAGVTDGTALGEYDRYNMQRMLTLSANIYGEDLGRAAARVQQAISDTGKPPDRVNVTVRGQVQPMAEMFGGLRLGLLMAVGVILLLLAANFQSFRLSLAVGLTIPAVIAGVVLMLWLTRTTLNIQSFMGAIMAIGVAVANAILLVTFAERSRVAGREPWEAGNRRRTEPSASDPDDQFRDAGRDGADGAGPRRRGRAKRAAWAGGDRRSPRRNVRHSHHPAGDLGHAPVATCPDFPRRSILTTRTAPISSRGRGSRRCRIVDALNTMRRRRNKRQSERILKAEHNECHEPNGHKGLGGWWRWSAWARGASLPSGTWRQRHCQ
jgi:uncharacterized membrane protein